MGPSPGRGSCCSLRRETPFLSGANKARAWDLAVQPRNPALETPAQPPAAAIQHPRSSRRRGQLGSLGPGPPQRSGARDQRPGVSAAGHPRPFSAGFCTRRAAGCFTRGGERRIKRAGAGAAAAVTRGSARSGTRVRAGDRVRVRTRTGAAAGGLGGAGAGADRHGARALGAGGARCGASCAQVLAHFRRGRGAGREDLHGGH